MKACLNCAAMLVVWSGAAEAQSNVGIVGEQTTYSGSYGKRTETTIEAGNDLGATAFSVSASNAKRTFDDRSFSAVRVAGTVYHDWNDRFYTKTTASLSSDKPVFAARELANDVNYKLLPNAVLTVGGRYARYGSRTDVLSWSAGGSWYFPGGFATYRYGFHRVDGLGNTHGHLATLRVKDPRGGGQTQLWVGGGTSLHEQDAFDLTRAGRFRSAALQRVQPIHGPVALSLTAGRAWYRTDVGHYHGTSLSLGLVVRDRRLFGGN